ncbi:hypothetical protein D9757_003592 [Collybiopsis confluens]|uniref:Thioredoxin domain-containing protein n=1 Tax=Collybiopsis confluens TaxID=2823264 RepID=A0A8H5HUV5_9AGAR|nr:hypothetical protein D9757_003592 [Collybiopsis confluens]
MSSSLALRALKSSRLLSARPLQSVSSLRTFSSSSSRLEHYPDADFPTFKKITSGPESEGRLVLVDFYAKLSPILERLSKDSDVKSGSGLPVDVMTVNTESEDGMELSQRYKIRALPTVIAFREGKGVSQFVGALPEHEVAKFLTGV